MLHLPASTGEEDEMMKSAIINLSSLSCSAWKISRSLYAHYTILSLLGIHVPITTARHAGLALQSHKQHPFCRQRKK